MYRNNRDFVKRLHGFSSTMYQAQSNRHLWWHSNDTLFVDVKFSTAISALIFVPPDTYFQISEN